MLPTPGLSPSAKLSGSTATWWTRCLPKVLDAIVDAGATYEILELEMGTTPSTRAIRDVSCRDEAALDALLEVQVHGVNVEDGTPSSSRRPGRRAA